jgi:GMP synthase (glutamine-hydrolysing)
LRIAVLQHVDCEPPGAYGPILEKHAAVESCRLGHDSLPELTEFDGIVAMGGPMGVYETTAYPWIADEVEGIRAALEAGVAVWGVCLGAQLLAAAAGADVYLGGQPEVGVSTVALTDGATADPVFANLAGALTVLHWHGDTFQLPDGAVLLAASGLYERQAFRLGRSYGIQFHLETPWDLAKAWLELPAYRQSLEDASGPGAADRLRHDLLATQDDMRRTAELVIGRWIETLRS